MRDTLLVLRAAALLYARQRREAAAANRGVDASDRDRERISPSSTFRVWLRCMWRTGGTHDLDLSAGRCRHCRKRWSELYPDDPAPSGSYLR
jgi:hypothetical protein